MYIMRSRHGGVFFPDVRVGEYVRAGQRIGEMQNIRADTLVEFTAPLTGVVLMMYTTPVRTSGETILIMGRMDEIPDS
jgi:predicted deacylase